MQWAVGITTVPSRRATLLPGAVTSVRAAGFEPHLFVDGDDDARSWRAEFGVPVTCRYPPVLVAGNWVLSIYELYYRSPLADRYAIFQDDVTMVRNCREYLDRIAWPDKHYFNLYAAPTNWLLVKHKAENGFRGWYPSNQAGKGALALVFTREGLQTLLAAEHLVKRPADCQAYGWRRIDGGVSDSMRKAGWSEMFHVPSLVSHEGITPSFNKLSYATAADALTIPQDNKTWNKSFGGCGFPGVNFDATSWL